MQDKLPLSLIEEQADGEISAENRYQKRGSESFQEPDGIDSFRRGCGLRAMSGRLWRGARHVSRLYEL